MPSGGPVASGRRSSKLGTGGPGLGFGPGDGGVSREQRWSIVFNQGQTAEEYARQLDALKVELAVVTPNNQLVYVSNFSSPEPTKRYGSGQKRQSPLLPLARRGRQGIRRRAPEEGGRRGRRERVSSSTRRGSRSGSHAWRSATADGSPSEIRVTRFQVVPAGNGYDFKVIAQEALR